MAIAGPGYLAAQLGPGLELVYGRSRTLPVQVRHKNGRLHMRLHQMFQQAPEEVLAALCAWVRSGRRARRSSQILDSWIAEQLSALPPRQPGRLQGHGRCHDLRGLAQNLYAREFADDFQGNGNRPLITWGRRTRTRARHSLQLGSYDPETRLVRVHPVLDRAEVPEWFVRHILFHEILHAALPPRMGSGGRLIHHSREFRQRERRHPDHGRAHSWQRQHLKRLIRLARSGQ